MRATLGAILGGSATYALGCDGLTCATACGLAAVSVRIALTDLKLRIIRDLDVLALAAIGFVWTLWSGSDPVTDLGTAALRGLGYAVGFQAIRLGYVRLRGRDGLGFGDVKLVGAAGPLLVIDVFAFAVATAALGGIAFVLFRASLKRRAALHHTYVPFGSTLAISIYASWFISFVLN